MTNMTNKTTMNCILLHIPLYMHIQIKIAYFLQKNAKLQVWYNNKNTPIEVKL